MRPCIDYSHISPAHSRAHEVKKYGCEAHKFRAADPLVSKYIHSILKLLYTHYWSFPSVSDTSNVALCSQVITVFSAPNYCESYENFSAYMRFWYSHVFHAKTPIRNTHYGMLFLFVACMSISLPTCTSGALIYSSKIPIANYLYSYCLLFSIKTVLLIIHSDGWYCFEQCEYAPQPFHLPQFANVFNYSMPFAFEACKCCFSV